MTNEDPVRSVSSRLWGWVLSALGLVIALNILWALVRPWLPMIVVACVLVVAVRVWNRWRWR